MYIKYCLLFVVKCAYFDAVRTRCIFKCRLPNIPVFNGTYYT